MKAPSIIALLLGIVVISQSVESTIVRTASGNYELDDVKLEQEGIALLKGPSFVSRLNGREPERHPIAVRISIKHCPSIRVALKRAMKRMRFVDFMWKDHFLKPIVRKTNGGKKFVVIFRLSEKISRSY